LISPIPFASARLVELIDVEADHYSVMVSAKAPGLRPRPEDRTSRYFKTLGRLMGRMHDLARRYRAPDDSCEWLEWREVCRASRAADCLAGQPKVVARCEELVRLTADLPKDADSFGPIHGDVIEINLTLGDGEITLLDFDDCRLDWFASDLAVTLFHALRYHPQSDPNGFARFLMEHLLSGYREEHQLSPAWLGQEEGHLDDLDPWSASFMIGRRESIENGTPIVDIDLARL